jgi:hypothetical protein
MAERFDPYHKWLGIPPSQQPPHHYRLLGLEAFEADRDVIESAANQRMAYLQELAVGEHLKESQQLLNEVAAARRCLLNAQQKAAYDAQLRASLPAGGPAPPVWTVSDGDREADLAALPSARRAGSRGAAAGAGAKASASRAALAKSRSGQKQTDSLFTWLAVGIGAAVLLGAGAILLSLNATAPRPTTPTPAAPRTEVTFRWDIRHRQQAVLVIDGKARTVPETEEFTLPLAPGKHDFVFRRDGFQDNKESVTLRAGEPRKVEVGQWYKPLPRVVGPVGLPPAPTSPPGSSSSSSKSTPPRKSK